MGRFLGYAESHLGGELSNKSEPASRAVAPTPQKSGEWEEKRKEILGIFNAQQWDNLNANGDVTLTAEQQRKEGDHNCRDAKKAVDEAAKYFQALLTSQRASIAAKVEGIQFSDLGSKFETKEYKEACEIGMQRTKLVALSAIKEE